MEEKQPGNSTFYIHWISLLLGTVLGLVAVLFIYFTQKVNRRDKVYSALLGMAIGMVINFYLIRELHLLPVN